MHLDLPVRTWHRLDEGLSDDAIGERLRAMVQRALDEGSLGAAVVVVRTDRVDVFDLAPLVRERADLRMLAAALTRVEVEHAGEAEAVGLMGRFLARTGEGPGVPVALVFLEWSDCRWWRWQHLLDPRSGAPREGAELISRAVDGAPRPDGLGGWWTLGRRARVRGRLAPKERVVVH